MFCKRYELRFELTVEENITIVDFATFFVELFLLLPLVALFQELQTDIRTDQRLIVIIRNFSGTFRCLRRNITVWVDLISTRLCDTRELFILLFHFVQVSLWDLATTTKAIGVFDPKRRRDGLILVLDWNSFSSTYISSPSSSSFRFSICVFLLNRTKE